MMILTVVVVQKKKHSLGFRADMSTTLVAC